MKPFYRLRFDCIRVNFRTVLLTKWDLFLWTSLTSNFEEYRYLRINIWSSRNNDDHHRTSLLRIISWPFRETFEQTLEFSSRDRCGSIFSMAQWNKRSFVCSFYTMYCLSNGILLFGSYPVALLDERIALNTDKFDESPEPNKVLNNIFSGTSHSHGYLHSSVFLHDNSGLILESDKKTSRNFVTSCCLSGANIDREIWYSGCCHSDVRKQTSSPHNSSNQADWVATRQKQLPLHFCNSFKWRWEIDRLVQSIFY